jgi:pimeloyl-ACP methyl ester carboxylesterase
MEMMNVNDAQLAFERRGKGNPLVLIHGYPLEHTIWDQTARLLENDFELILPDVRGFGGSTALSTTYSMADMAEELSAMLGHLKIEKAAFAGHSMGGYIALEFAKKFPGRVSGMALVSSQIVADSEERKQGRYKTAVEVDRTGVGIVADAMTDKLSPNQSVRDVVRPMIKRQSKSGVMGALKAMAEREDSTALFSTFKFPVVVLHGEADELIPVERAREAKAVLPQANLLELQGVGHMPMMEAPEKTAEALRLLK